MRSTRVHFRLNDQVFIRYSSQAQSQDMALGSYLRWRLEQQDQFLAAEAAMLKRSVSQAPTTSGPTQGATPSLPPGMFVETLLLLRSLVGPQKLNVAQKEVERRGLETWR